MNNKLLKLALDLKKYAGHRSNCTRAAGPCSCGYDALTNEIGVLQARARAPWTCHSGVTDTTKSRRIMYQISYDRLSQNSVEKHISGATVNVETLSCVEPTAENRQLLHDTLDEYLDNNICWDIPEDSDIGFRVMGRCISHNH